MDKSNEVLCILTQGQKKEIDRVIKTGNSIEIHPAKDGVKIYEVIKKTIK